MGFSPVCYSLALLCLGLAQLIPVLAQQGYVFVAVLLFVVLAAIATSIGAYYQWLDRMISDP
jgi:hypothetical protein